MMWKSKNSIRFTFSNGFVALEELDDDDDDGGGDDMNINRAWENVKRE